MSIKKPTTTPFPDEILDYWLPELSFTELRCLCYIIRHTFGYGKNITGDPISLRQFRDGIKGKDGRVIDRGCGIKNFTALCSALRSLEEKGLIKRTFRHSIQGDEDVTIYVLNLEDEDAWPTPQASAARAAGMERAPADVMPPQKGAALKVVAAAGRPRGVLLSAQHPATLSAAPPPFPPTGVLLSAQHPATPTVAGCYSHSSTGATPSAAQQKTTIQKTTLQETTSKKQERGVRAAAPPPRRRARDHLEMVSTTDDPKATRERRLALKLAGDVLGCASVNVGRLAAYERFCSGLLAQDYTTVDLCRWMDWMNSGTAYWAGNARRWTEQRMMDDLADWDGHGRPASKGNENA